MRCSGRRGLPDLLLAGPGGIAFMEAKTGSSLSGDQILWRDTLRAAGATWALVQPGSLWDGSADQTLHRLAGRA